MSSFLLIAQNLADRLDATRPTTIYNSDLSVLDQTTRRWREHINLAYNIVKLALGRTDEYRQTSTTLALVANTESYDIPTGMLNIDQIQVATDPPLDIISWVQYEEYKRMWLTVTSTGFPTVCSIYQRKIWFYPTPDQAITANIRGQENNTDLDLDDAIPDLPADYHRVIQELAIFFENQYEGNPGAGQLAVSESGTLEAQGGQAAVAVNLFNLVRKNSGDHQQEPPRMRSRYESQRKNALRRAIYY